MEKLNKKEKMEQYKNRTVIGGIYCIKCKDSGNQWIKSTKDLQGQKNRFGFFVSTEFCPEPGMSQDWKQYGAASFSFEILEELEKGETQTDKEFAEDIRVLLDIWKEKHSLEEGE